jgi:acetoin utilization protein AcuB
MYVGWYMKTNLITVTPETSLFKAREILDSHRISHLPVTDGKAHLVGLLTDRDLKEAWASPATTLSVHELTYVLQKLSVGNVMIKDVITATPDMPMERAALTLHDNKIGALPVLKDGKLVGIITTTDLMEVLLTAVGLTTDSRRFSLLATDRIGLIADIGRLMQQAGINIRSILVAPLEGHEEIWQIMLRVGTSSYPVAVKVLEDANYKVLTGYVEDFTPYLP